MNTQQFPTIEQLNAELKRTRGARHFGAFWHGVLIFLLIVMAAAIVAAFMLLSVIRIQGSSMFPTLENGDVVIALKWTDIESGDLTAFSFNDKLLVKRVIACGGEEISILPDGTVSINGVTRNEDYVLTQSSAASDITFPYIVPQDRFFVLGDERSVSLDSRHSLIGCIAPEQVAGRVFLRIWPLDRITLFD